MLSLMRQSDSGATFGGRYARMWDSRGRTGKRHGFEETRIAVRHHRLSPAEMV